MDADHHDVFGAFRARDRVLSAFVRDPHRYRTLNLAGAFDDAADNLLNKALAAFETDRARALRYVDRLVGLPLDEGGEPPAAFRAHMLLYNLICDAVEDAEAEDGGCFDAAAAVAGSAPDAGLRELADVLRDVDGGYQLPTRERMALRSLVARLPPSADTELRGGALGEYVIAVLETIVAYRNELAASLGLGDE